MLQLFTEANADARLSAASKLDKRREAVNADIIASALVREKDTRVIESLEGLYSSLLLSNPDPEKRIAAISAIAADATMRNRTTISQFLEKETNKDDKQLLRRLHVKDNDKVLEGAEAFLYVWQKIPKYRFLYKFFKLPIIFIIFNYVYEIVAYFLYLKNKKQLKN